MRFETKGVLREASNHVHMAVDCLNDIRQHFDMEWGRNQNTDLDVALSCAENDLLKVQRDLDEILRKFKGRAMAVNYPKG